MPTTYKNPVYPYRRPPELDVQDVRHYPVVIVGAGPSGLAAAIDLAQQGIHSIVLDDNNTVSVGRGHCALPSVHWKLLTV